MWDGYRNRWHYSGYVSKVFHSHPHYNLVSKTKRSIIVKMPPMNYSSTFRSLLKPWTSIIPIHKITYLCHMLLFITNVITGYSLPVNKFKNWQERFWFSCNTIILHVMLCITCIYICYIFSHIHNAFHVI